MEFNNVGTTCYVNAAIQCILSKALSHALLDPESTQMFRRYSSNPVLLALGIGSVNSAENDFTDDDDKSNVAKEGRRMLRLLAKEM
eukprot:scaffold5177_cov147-Chaetoceros_neogracile.AAC.2